ncbi:MAG: hypothetical protein ACI83D_000560 [Planctomycetota bacterium]|jgi:hypothetical protein
MEPTIQKVTPKKRIGRRIKWIAFFLLLVLLTYGYFWCTGSEKRENKVQEAIQTEIDTELNRCKNFITQETGNFGNFEYCQQFIQWHIENIEPLR